MMYVCTWKEEYKNIKQHEQHEASLNGGRRRHFYFPVFVVSVDLRVVVAARIKYFSKYKRKCCENLVLEPGT